MTGTSLATSESLSANSRLFEKSASGKSIEAVTFHQSWLLASFETNW